MKKQVQPFIQFNITQKCNYCCDYCTQHKPHTPLNASDDVINGFLYLLKKLEQKFEIDLLGGEPFCHPKFIETVGKIADLGHTIMVTSNVSFSVSAFEKLINVCGGRLRLLRCSLHISQIKNLDANIRNIAKIKELLNPETKLEIVSVLTDENFKTLQYIENELSKNDIALTYQRLIINGEISRYSQDIEKYLKPREHKYNSDMENARKINTKKVLCYAGSKVFHVLTDGTIVRCWSNQSRHQFLGNVTSPESIKLLKSPAPCYSPVCFCQHPAARNAYFYSCLTPLYRAQKFVNENIKKADTALRHIAGAYRL